MHLLKLTAFAVRFDPLEFHLLLSRLKGYAESHEGRMLPKPETLKIHRAPGGGVYKSPNLYVSALLTNDRDISEDQQKYDPDTKRAGSLLGDRVANRIVFDISSAIESAG